MIEQQILAPFRCDPEWYGILRPRHNSKLTIKSVTADMARLFISLEDAAPFPQTARDALGNDCALFIGKLVLDAILQIEVNGEMLCGPMALQVVAGEREPVKRRARIAALSRRALRKAAASNVLSLREVSAQLYRYNREPASTRWRRRLGDHSAVESFLGLNEGALAVKLDESWMRLAVSSDDWIVWQSRSVSPIDTTSAYKLYISPPITELSAVLGSVVDSASRFGAFQWKIGGNLNNLVRPDKLLLYFNNFADLENAADYLVTTLRGCTPQGVPFTAELGARGLVSWGIDPPAEKNSVPWLARESWRWWICNRLASAVVLAKTVSGGISASTFALQRLRLDGVDTETWIPEAWI